tara:strand:+ start:577 stop:2019 length:1443 start_codon:yes stop_codon:yes gene_type:complete
MTFQENYEKNNMDIQAEQCIGLLGMTADGKTTFIKELTGIDTRRSQEELKSGRTVKIGYSIMDIFNIDGIICNHKTEPELVNNFDVNTNSVKRVAFVDCPGHYDMIRTMLCSVNMMQGVIIIIGYDEKELKEKTSLLEHLATVKRMGLNKIIVCLNKVDLAKGNEGIIRAKMNEIHELLSEYEIELSFPIIPISALSGWGLDIALYSIDKVFNDKVKEEKGDEWLFLTSRKFDANKKGSSFQNLKGMILGGSLNYGYIEIPSDELDVEIRPGLIYEHQYKVDKRTAKQWYMKRLFTKVKGIGFDDPNGNCIKVDKLESGLASLETDLFPMLTDGRFMIPEASRINKGANITIVSGSDEDATKIFKIGDMTQKIICMKDRSKEGSNLYLDVCNMISINDFSTESNFQYDKNYEIVVLNQIVIGKVQKIKEKIIINLKNPICVSTGDRVIVLDLVNKSADGESMIVAYGKCGESGKKVIEFE